MMMTMPARIENSRRPGADEAADKGGAGAERHEHGGEAEHEHQRRGHHRALRGLCTLVIGDVLDGRAGQVDQIGRHQRQHAGRQEADQAGKKRRRDRNIVHYLTFEEFAVRLAYWLVRNRQSRGFAAFAALARSQGRVVHLCRRR